MSRKRNKQMDLRLLILCAILLGLFTNNVLMGQDDQYISAKEAQGLEVGAKAPLWSAQNAEGETVELDKLLKKEPVVMVFYRGHWCPVCNKHLQALQDDLHKITERGAQVIAISPEKSEFLQKTRDKTGAEFSLLYDESYAISEAYGVKFRPGSATRVMYNTVLGADLKEAHSDDSQQLPIPATYIIDQNREIVWRHFNPDYKKRASVNEILENLPK